MNSAHDLGGMQGFGPVVGEPEKPIFHGEWEERALAIVIAMAASGKWNLDKSRHARESLPPPQYLNSSYYEIWIAGLESLMLEVGLVTSEELESGKMLEPAIPVKGVLKADAVEGVLKAGGHCGRPISNAAEFEVGDQVRVKNFHPMGHTRAPRYVRGHLGTIISAHGGYVYPDSNARGDGEDPQWLYTCLLYTSPSPRDRG